MTNQMTNQSAVNNKAVQIIIGVLVVVLFLPVAYGMLALGGGGAVSLILDPIIRQFPWNDLAMLLIFQIGYMAVVYAIRRVVRVNWIAMGTAGLIMLIFDVSLAVMLAPCAYGPCK
jgi:hypothetical protein